MPIVTLSKSMSSAAFGAWCPTFPSDAGFIACGPRWIGAIAWGPRCTGADCLCALLCADRCGREFIVFGYECFGYGLAILVATAARRVDPATDAAGGASSGPCEPGRPQSAGRRILEVAPYGYNLNLNPHESTPVPHASRPDPVVVRDRTGVSAHAVVERDGQYGPAISERENGLGQRRRQ